MQLDFFHQSWLIEEQRLISFFHHQQPPRSGENMYRVTTNVPCSKKRTHSSLVNSDSDSDSDNKDNQVKKQAKRQEDDHEKQNAQELADNCIYQILESLSTRLAIRATILSKQWERVWSLVPVLNFDEKEPYFGKFFLGDYYQHEKFVKFVTMCLKRRENDKQLDKFRLCMGYCQEDRTDSRLMDKWLSFAVKRNVKELCISPIMTSVEGHPNVGLTTTYCLPHTVFVSQSLTILNLECLTITGNDDDILAFSLPSLKSLSLRYVKTFVELGFFNLQSWCPSLENLSIIGGSSFANILKVSSSSLKYLEVIDRRVKIQVEAVNLESFRFGSKTAVGEMKFDCHIEMGSCGALRNLDIYNGIFESAWFEGFGCRFPLLESLVLYKCCIRSTGCINAVSFNAPNLRSFRFSGCRQISFCMNVPKLSEAFIILDDHNDSKWGSSRRRDFLSNFNCCGRVSIYAIDPKALIFPEKMRKRKSCCPPLASVKHMEVTVQQYPIGYATEGITDSVSFRDSLRWMAPALETLSVNKKCWENFDQDITSNLRVPVSPWTEFIHN